MRKFKPKLKPELGLAISSSLGLSNLDPQCLLAFLVTIALLTPIQKCFTEHGVENDFRTVGSLQILEQSQKQIFLTIFKTKRT